MGKTMQKLVGHSRAFSLHVNRMGKHLWILSKEGNKVRFTFWKSHSGFNVSNSL